MKGFFRKNQQPTFAAGGIVVRGERDPLVAVVKQRKGKAWVLPKGKLKPQEEARAAAKREVLEETGHEVAVHEFLGSMSHEAGDGNLKVIQFWRMEAISREPVRPLMRDVKAVEWLPLDEAVKKLTHSREQVFLANVGPAALQAARGPLAPPVQPAAEDMIPKSSERGGLVSRVRSWVRGMSLAPSQKKR